MPLAPEAMNVLVVDDEEAIVELVGEYLRARGHTVLTASDGQAALQAMQSHPLDVVLADLRLPSLGGMSLLEASSQLPRPVGVVVMTGYGTVETATQAMKLGASDYLLKPVRLREVHDALQAAVEEVRERQAAARRKELCLFFEELLGLRGPVGIDALVARLCGVLRHATGASRVQGEVQSGDAWAEVCSIGTAALDAHRDVLEAQGDGGGGVRISIYGATAWDVERELAHGLVERLAWRVAELAAD